MIGTRNSALSYGLCLTYRRRWFSPEGDGGAGDGGTGQGDPGNGTQGAGDNNDANNAPPPDFDAWLKTQDEPTQTLISGRFEKLEGALRGEREGRKTLEKQLKTLSGKTEEGSELRQQLDKALADFQAEGDRADFYEDSLKQGVSDLRLAWLAYSADKEKYTRRGQVDWDSLKADHPSLFAGPAAPRANAGAGTGTQTPGGQASMNDLIRGKAGRPVKWGTNHAV